MRNIKNNTGLTNDAGTHERRRNRRRLIQTLALGGGVVSSKLIPQQWTSPAVNAILLPAHASRSMCSLGNSEVVLSDASILQQDEQLLAKVGNGSTSDRSLTVQVFDALIPEVLAVDGPEFGVIGCFRIDFVCNSNSGTLCALAVPVGGDNEAEPICAGFESGEQGNLEGFCFVVTLQDGGASAELQIAFSCGELGEPIPLGPDFEICKDLPLGGP